MGRRVIFHGGAVHHEVDGRLLNAGLLFERPLNEGLAGGAGHAGHRKGHAFVHGQPLCSPCEAVKPMLLTAASRCQRGGLFQGRRRLGRVR